MRSPLLLLAGYYRELPHTAHPYAISESGGGSGGALGGGHRGHRPPPASGRVPLTQSSMASQLGYPATQGSQGGYGFSQDSLNLG
jgi:hypothetical protein